jgi:hypothetical protein
MDLHQKDERIGGLYGEAFEDKLRSDHCISCEFYFWWFEKSPLEPSSALARRRDVKKFGESINSISGSSESVRATLARATTFLGFVVYEGQLVFARSNQLPQIP